MASRLQKLRDRMFRLRGPQRVPVVIHHNRIYLMPTRAGLAFSLMLLTMMLVSINYGLSLGLVLTFSLGGVALAGAMRGFRNLLGLVVSDGKVTPVFCGTPASFTLLLENRRNGPRLSLEFVTDDHATRVPQLDSNLISRVCINVMPRERGWLVLPWVKLQTCYPLGLVNVWSYVRPDARALVYPQPEANPPPLPPAPGEEGQHQAAGIGADDFVGLRAHQPSDPPRHIAWKVVARDGPLVVKQYSGIAGGTLTLDWAQIPDTLSVELKLSRLTAWVCRAHDDGSRWQLITPEVDLGPDRGDKHYEACLRALALHGYCAQH